MAARSTAATVKLGALEPAAAGLLDVFEAEVPAITERGANAICLEIPAYTRIADAALVADIQATMTRNVEAMLRSLRRGERVTDDELRFIRAPTTRRLRMRLSLADFLQAYRVGHRVLWEGLAALATDQESKDAAFALVAPVMEFINTISTHVAEVYVEVEQLLVAEGERVRRDVLEELLTGCRPPPGPRAEALRAAGLAGTGTFVVITARPTTTPHDDHLPRAAVKALGDLAQGLPSPLAVLRGDEIVAVVPLARDRAGEFAERLRAARSRLVDLGIDLTIGASTIVPGLEQLPAAYREATEARALGGTGACLCLCQLSAFEYLALRGDETAGRLISPEIAAFVEADVAEGGALTATLLEYAASNLNVKAAAERLHIHVNTAHYRLTRIAERTGVDLRDLQSVIEILIAIKLADGRVLSHGPDAG